MPQSYHTILPMEKKDSNITSTQHKRGRRNLTIWVVLFCISPRRMTPSIIPVVATTFATGSLQKHACVVVSVAGNTQNPTVLALKRDNPAWNPTPETQNAQTHPWIKTRAKLPELVVPAEQSPKDCCFNEVIATTVYKSVPQECTSKTKQSHNSTSNRLTARGQNHMLKHENSHDAGSVENAKTT
jgi:hypothetical protein